MSKFTLLIFACAIIGCDLSFQLPSLESRIIGGQDAKIQQVPYQLSLFHSNQFIGGASIIGNKWAITAAHCVANLNAKNLRVGAGHEIIQMGKFYNILNVKIHEKYGNFDNDIALLEIDGTFQFGNNIKAVDLPNLNTEPQNDLNVVISGWGTIKAKKPYSFPTTLKQVTVSIVDRSVCMKKYSKVPPGVNDNMICAGDVKKGGKDACLNDSGGPMVANNKLYGIVSWGKDCGAKYPGVYTNVAKYREWIKNVAKI